MQKQSVTIYSVRGAPGQRFREPAGRMRFGEPQYGHRVGFFVHTRVPYCRLRGHQGRLVAVPGTTTNGGSEVRQMPALRCRGHRYRGEHPLLLRRPVHHRRLRSGPYDVGTVRHHLRVPEMGAGRDPARRVCDVDCRTTGTAWNGTAGRHSRFSVCARTPPRGTRHPRRQRTAAGCVLERRRNPCNRFRPRSPVLVGVPVRGGGRRLPSADHRYCPPADRCLRRVMGRYRLGARPGGGKHAGRRSEHRRKRSRPGRTERENSLVHTNAIPAQRPGWAPRTSAVGAVLHRQYAVHNCRHHLYTSVAARQDSHAPVPFFAVFRKRR